MKATCNRIGAFHLIDMLLSTEIPTDLTAHLISQLKIIQQNDKKQTLNYIEGLHGCGVYFEDILKNYFFSILTKIV